MTRRPWTGPARGAVRPAASLLLCAALATAPLLGVGPARGVTPEEAAAAGYIPNPAPALARIAIDGVTPNALDGSEVGGTEAGVPTVTVSGTVRNVSTQHLESVDVRLQRGPRVAGADAVREPLVWSEPSFPVHGTFERVGERLAPGEVLPFRVTLPARDVPGRPGPHLELTEPGVYPLLVNVNGTPEGGSPARLDDARTLLPVIDTPTGPEPAAPDPADPEADPGPDPDATPEDAPPGDAPPLTLLWPLSAPPSRIAHVPGADGTDPVVALTDDSLLRDLGPEGRLTGLVRAAERAFDGPTGTELRRATCLAVDPDLLDTVADIADGRSVVIDRGPGPAPTGTGRGAGRTDDESTPADSEAASRDASRWLDQLRALAEGGCVVTLPAAQADLDAVASVGDSRLAGAALDRPGTVRRVLEVAPVPDLVVPASGTLAPGSPEALGLGRATALVAAPAVRTDTGDVPDGGLLDLAGTPGARALTYPAALGSALAATGVAPENPRYSDPGTRYWLEADSPAARLQDARATLLAPVVDVAAGTRPPAGDDPGVLAVPPAVWTVDESSAASLLDTLAAQLDAGRMRAQPLTERLTGPTAGPAGTLADYPTAAFDPGEVDPTGATAERLRGSLRGIATLGSLVDTTDPRSEVADDFLDPMVGDALRALSVTGRRAGGDGVEPATGTGVEAAAHAEARVERLSRTVTSALGRVDLLPPGSVFTMASPNSPLLLVARNGLPFPVRVAVEVTAPPDFHLDPVGVVQIPAAGSRTLQVPTQSDAEGGDRHTVTFALHGPDGRPLSDPVELSVQAGGYPVAQVFALSAAALALVLGLRRYLRYRRGTPDPADEGHRP